MSGSVTDPAGTSAPVPPPGTGAEPATGARRSSRWLLALRILALAPLVLAIGAYLLMPTVRASLDEGLGLLWARDVEGLRAWGGQLGWWAPLATGVLMLVQAIAAPIPAFVVTATNSFLLGPFWGGLYSIATATVAAIICYELARWIGEPLVARLVSGHGLDKARRFLDRHGAHAILVARLVPVVPFDPISFLAGLLSVRLWTFTWATFIGQLPAGLAYSYLAQQVDRPATLLPAALGTFGALLLLGFLVTRWLSGRGAAPGDDEGK